MNLKEIRRHHWELANEMSKEELELEMNKAFKVVKEMQAYTTWSDEQARCARAVWFQYRCAWLERNPAQLYDLHSLEAQVYRDEMWTQRT